MKRLFKIAVNFMAFVIMAVCAFSFSACEDIENLELTLRIYNYDKSAFYAESDVKMSVDLYRHLAPKTVDKVIEHVKAGYYNNAIFYKETDYNYSSQIMLGDLKLDEGGNLVLNKIGGKLPSEIYGEFESNGTTGSNLVSAKGSIGIWRSYYESDAETYKASSNARNSGRATWYIPTSTISSYNGYFCVFAQYDTADTANSKAISALSTIFSNSDYYTEYVIYYTGEYGDLQFHAVKKSDWDDADTGYDEDTKKYGEDTVFEAEGNQLVCYNYRTVKIPNSVNGEITAKVKSVKVK